jgi:hypothetical protein
MDIRIVTKELLKPCVFCEQWESTSYNMKFNHQIGALLVLAGIVDILITTEHSPT